MGAAGYYGDGLRAWRQVGTAAPTDFLDDGDQPVIETDGQGNLTAVNTFGADGLLSRHAGAGAGSAASTFYAFDLQGGVAQRTDKAGAVTGSGGFSAFGPPVSGAQDPWGFGAQAGGYTDPGGLVLMGRRYYDPATGRFLTRDPSGYGGGVNLYEYADNDPIDEDDPSGLDPYLVHDRNDTTGGFTGKTYFMDVPHGIGLGPIIQDFKGGLNSLPSQFEKNIAEAEYYQINNADGERWDFKSYSDSASCPNQYALGSLYRRRYRAGNFLYGALMAAAHHPLRAATFAGQAFRIKGKLKDYKHWRQGGWLHPADEQQAIIDGWFWQYYQEPAATRQRWGGF